MPPVARITFSSIAEQFDDHVQNSPCLMAVGSVIVAALVIITVVTILDFIFRKSFKEGEPADKSIQQLLSVAAIVFVSLFINNYAIRQKNKPPCVSPPPVTTPDASPQFAEQVARELVSEPAIASDRQNIFAEYA